MKPPGSRGPMAQFVCSLPWRAPKTISLHRAAVGRLRSAQSMEGSPNSVCQRHTIVNDGRGQPGLFTEVGRKLETLRRSCAIPFGGDATCEVRIDPLFVRSPCPPRVCLMRPTITKNNPGSVAENEAKIYGCKAELPSVVVITATVV